MSFTGICDCTTCTPALSRATQHCNVGCWQSHSQVGAGVDVPFDSWRWELQQQQSSVGPMAQKKLLLVLSIVWSRTILGWLYVSADNGSGGSVQGNKGSDYLQSRRYYSTNPNPILLHLLRRSRVPNGIRSGRDEGRGVDQLRWCGQLSTPFQPFQP